jgi:hypothetical protein
MTGDVVGDINYFTSTTDGCLPRVTTQAASAKMKSNLVQVPVPVTIQDLRGVEKSVNLDTNGFEVIKYNGSIQDEFEKGSEAQKNYYEEISQLLKKRLGASRVIIYHYAFRFRNSPLSNGQCNQTHRNPAFYPHIDLDSFGVPGVLERELGKEEGEKAKKNRIQVINIWRPLGPNPITDKPLAMCDYLSIDIGKDVHQFTFYGLEENHTSCTLSRNDQYAHMWYYLSQMRSDEMFIFKTFDSKPDVAQFAFHTAVTIGNEPTPNEEQKSLELRCMVFYDE